MRLFVLTALVLSLGCTLINGDPTAPDDKSSAPMSSVPAAEAYTLDGFYTAQGTPLRFDDGRELRLSDIRFSAAERLYLLQVCINYGNSSSSMLLQKPYVERMNSTVEFEGNYMTQGHVTAGGERFTTTIPVGHTIVPLEFVRDSTRSHFTR
jgi:hypothetical protein